MLRKTLLMGVLRAVFVGDTVQIWLGVVVCQMALLLQALLNPYANKKLNTLNFTSMFCLLAILVGASWFHHESTVAASAVVTPNNKGLEKALPHLLVTMLLVTPALGLIVLLLMLRDAYVHKRDSNKAWLALPPSFRDEVPPEMRKKDLERQKREKRELLHEQMNRHAEDGDRQKEAASKQAAADSAIGIGLERGSLADADSTADSTAPGAAPAARSSKQLGATRGSKQLGAARGSARGSKQLAAAAKASAQATAKPEDTKKREKRDSAQPRGSANLGPAPPAKPEAKPSDAGLDA